MTSKGNKSYFVQKILDMRTTKVGATEYLLKWATGYEDSWEPEENIINCDVLIRKYNYNLVKFN